jgi:tetratricopeptide (TPR) repeat protein
MAEPRAQKQEDRVHAASGLAVSDIGAQASRIAQTVRFRKAKQLARFLGYAVEKTLAGNDNALKETVLGIEVFGRGPDFDPGSDPIVRIDARRLRARLAEYYESEGAGDPIVIEFELGSYIPRFRSNPTDRETTPKRSPSPAPKSNKSTLLSLTKLAQAKQQLDSLTPAGIVNSMALFERIIAANPEHALAHAGYAMASMVKAIFFYEPSETAMPRARASLERALAIDPGCAEAHALLGAVRALHEFDFPAANAAFLMASRLKPDAASVVQARAAFYLAPLGFLEEAAEEVRYALERESRSLLYLHNLGWIQYLARDYQGALATAERILKANRHLVPAIYLRALACERLGRHALASAAFLSDHFRSSYPLAPLRSEALRLARAGSRAEAAEIAGKMEALYQPGVLNALAVAEVFVAVEDFDRAFQWLESAYCDRRHRLIYLKSDPAWDPIRSDPRFASLVAQMGAQTGMSA